MESGVKNMNIIVVDSVKGGCGKTSISLKCAIDRANNGKDRKVCYLDLDLLGTSIEAFLCGNKFVGQRWDSEENAFESNKYPIQLKVKKAAKFYLNAIFAGKKFSDEFLSEIEITGSGDFSGAFWLLACNPSQNEKDRFKPSRQVNYMGQIDYDYFSAAIEKILEKLYELKFTDVVIDMPPNSDAYTDSLFNILLRKADSGDLPEIKPQYNVEIHIVNSFDKAHFQANCEWLKTMIRECDMKWVVKVHELFRLVFNDNIDYDELILRESGTRGKCEEYIVDKLGEMEKFNMDFPKAYFYPYDKRNILSATSNGGISFDSVNIELVEKRK